MPSRVTTIFPGVDHLSFDHRKFNPSKENIEDICHFFKIGKLQRYEKEKGIIVSHSTFFVYVETNQGRYALKFYPRSSAKSLVMEYALNKKLTAYDFPTPAMYKGLTNKPFVISTGRYLATCFNFIDGDPVWKHLQEPPIIHQIITSMITLKNILSTQMGRISLPRYESLLTTINRLRKDSNALGHYEHKKIIDASALDACRRFQQHQRLFTRLYQHNDTNLTNFLVYKKTAYTLDLSHVKEDYILADLASLIISCYFLKIPKTIIENIIKRYFTQHQISSEHLIVFNTLVEIRLMNEYIKNVQREKTLRLSQDLQNYTKNFLNFISIRKKTIIEILRDNLTFKKMIIIQGFDRRPVLLKAVSCLK